MDIDQIMERHNGMQSRRSTFESMWERVAELVLPRSDDFRQRHAEGDQRNRNQYDAFPMLGLDRWSAAIESGLMPRQAYWHRLRTGEDDLDEMDEVKVYLEAMNEMLWRARYSPKGNFVGQSHECRVALGAFGTMGLLVEPREGGGTKYRAIHLNQLFIAENNEGMVDTVHREFEMTARQAVQTFREKTPDKVLSKYNDGKPDAKFTFIHCVMPREDYEPGRMDEQGLPFAGSYIMPEGKVLIDEVGYHEQPYIVSRYSVSSREVYGRSPAIQLLPDISMLNEMRRTTIEAANMAVDPPTLLHDDISEFDLIPGARNYGAMDDNGRPMATVWNNQSRVDIGLEMIKDTRNQIDDGFMGIYFRVLLENPNMTATQAMLLAQQQGQMTSPVIGRLQSEWLGPMIRRESGILYRQGKHPKMPQALMEYLAESDDGLQIEYESPLTRAAKAEEAVGILRAFESLSPIAQLDPTVFEMFDMQEIARTVAEVNGVPAKAIKSQARIDADKEAQDMQAEMGMMLDAAPVAAQTAKTLAEAQNISQNAPRPIPA